MWNSRDISKREEIRITIGEEQAMVPKGTPVANCKRMPVLVNRSMIKVRVAMVRNTKKVIMKLRGHGIQGGENKAGIAKVNMPGQRTRIKAPSPHSKLLNKIIIGIINTSQMGEVVKKITTTMRLEEGESDRKSTEEIQEQTWPPVIYEFDYQRSYREGWLNAWSVLIELSRLLPHGTANPVIK